jgi:uncharacterized protein (TIGR02646 family)
MIRVHRPPLSHHLSRTDQARLIHIQSLASRFERQDSRIDPAWRNFRRTKAGNAVYRALQATFRHKCAFCERVNAKTADHFHPKKRYPKRMFRWSNLLLCCAECNFQKGKFFPFVNRRPVLIDPTREDPADFFTWDFATGAMIESPDPVHGPRAQCTRDQLKLDEGPLRDERRMQLMRVVYLLSQIVRDHQAMHPETRQRLEEELHPNRPYLGILRFLFREPNGFREIVEKARAILPEIDDWTAEWL